MKIYKVLYKVKCYLSLKCICMSILIFLYLYECACFLIICNYTFCFCMCVFSNIYECMSVGLKFTFISSLLKLKLTEYIKQFVQKMCSL